MTRPADEDNERGRWTEVVFLTQIEAGRGLEDRVRALIRTAHLLGFVLLDRRDN